ncbi:MAG: hypothetical protein SWX82_34290 [Cyanobacteriota bacterium]|nr:hypothetical protein [Cyanobacteriota bacterium]
MDNSYCSADERSPYESNDYYWTIVIALLMSDRFLWQLLLFIYWTIVIAVLMSDRPTKAIITIGQ